MSIFLNTFKNHYYSCGQCPTKDYVNGLIIIHYYFIILKIENWKCIQMDTYTYLSENQISKNIGISNKNKKGKKKKKKKKGKPGIALFIFNWHCY